MGLRRACDDLAVLKSVGSNSAEFPRTCDLGHGKVRYAKGELHVICDNQSTHKHVTVRHWAQRHKRFQFHFSPRAVPG